MFLCGSFGCRVTVIDDVAALKAETDRIQWADAEKKKRGKFPPLAEQIEYCVNAYKRHKNIHRGSPNPPTPEIPR